MSSPPPAAATAAAPAKGSGSSSEWVRPAWMTTLSVPPAVEFVVNASAAGLIGFGFGARDGYRALPAALRTSDWRAQLRLPANAAHRYVLSQTAASRAGQFALFVGAYSGMDLGLRHLRSTRDLINPTAAGMTCGMAYGLMKGGMTGAGAAAGVGTGLLLASFGSFLAIMRTRLEVYVSPERQAREAEIARARAAERAQRTAARDAETASSREVVAERMKGKIPFVPGGSQPTPTATATPNAAATTTTATAANTTTRSSTPTSAPAPVVVSTINDVPR